MKTVCIYHSVDLDGYMSAAIVKHWFLSQNINKIDNYFIFEYGKNPYDNLSAETLEFLRYNYGQPIPDLSQYDKVIMCDISFPMEEMYDVLVNRIGNNLIWIDHHISAIKNFESLDGVTFHGYYSEEDFLNEDSTSHFLNYFLIDPTSN